MKLRIEDGILLRPYAIAWTPDGWGRTPNGWTPDDTNEWVVNRIDELMPEMTTKDNVVIPRIFAAQKAAAEWGDKLQEEKKPWPGWMPVAASLDRDISKAYKKLFMRMNEEAGEETAAKFVLRNRRIPVDKIKVEWPPDGWYEFKNGRIEPVEGE